MKVFIDCDVLLDVGLGREPFCEPAEQLLDYIQQSGHDGFIAWHSIANIHYILSKVIDQNQSKDFIIRLCQFITVVPTSNAEIFTAAQIDITDFEDALQCAAALKCNADIIVTRNISDYKTAPINAILPNTALQLLVSTAKSAEIGITAS